MKYGAVQWKNVQFKKARHATKRTARKQERRVGKNCISEYFSHQGVAQSG